MLLGVLLVLGVIILLATPGPWHRVVPATPRVQVGQGPPTDIAVFVHGVGSGRPCTAALWVHVRHDLPSVTAVVLPVRLACRLPAAGVQPLDEIVSAAGPAVAADALAERLGIRFDGWLALGQPALREAFPAGDAGLAPSGRLRLRILTDTWGGQGDPARVGSAQVRFLWAVGQTWRPRRLNLIAFTNYILGAPDSLTDMKLQAVTAVAQTLSRTPPRRIVVGALPAVVYDNGAYERWLPEPSSLLAYRVSFAADAMPPALPLSVDTRSASDSVVVLVERRDAAVKAFVTALGAQVDDYAGRHLRIEMLVCAHLDEVHAALQQRRERRPPLAAVVAFGQAGADANDGDQLAALTRAALLGARVAGLPAVVSVPAGSSAAVAEVLSGVAEDEGFPYAAAITAAPEPSAVPGVSPRDAARSSGRLAAECLVRAVQPAFFSPRLPATRLGVDYYERGSFEIAVAGLEGPVTVRLLDRLRAMGYRPERIQGDGVSGDAALAVPLSLRFAEGHRAEALCVAGDLGLARDDVTPSGDLPAAITLVTGNP
jgi:hypothetical protein